MRTPYFNPLPANRNKVPSHPYAGILTRMLAERPTATKLGRFPKAIPNFLLQLPPELRNNIYDIALADSDADGNGVACYKGLTGVNQQIREEFWPLFWRRANLYITSDQLPEVLRTFFPRTVASPVYPHSVTVTVDITGIDKNIAYVSLFPLLQAKPLCPETRWSFVPSKNSWPRRDAAWRREIVETYLIPDLCMNPNASAPADCGILKQVGIEIFNKEGWVRWHLIVQTEDGRLSAQDKWDIEKCCRDLRAFDRYRYFDSLPFWEQRKKVTVIDGVEEMEIYVWNPRHRRLDLHWHDVDPDDDEMYKCKCCKIVYGN